VTHVDRAAFDPGSHEEVLDMTMVPRPKLRARERAPQPSDRGPGRTASMGADRFLLKRELGSGGMGVVYEAFDREKNVAVALKTLRHVDANGLERFKKEFRALQGLEHPNVVSLGELLETRGEWFFTMELIEGCDFLSYVWGRTAPVATATDKARLDEPRLRSSLRELASGLVALHRRRLVHRDIKPSNILVTTEGRTVLMDFGLVTNASAARQSTAAHAIGTAAYMAPEQANGEKVSPLTDWYSVGVLLYEALTGQLPFSGSSMNVLMDKLNHEAPPPRTHVANLPPDLEELCVDLLRREPQQRPSTESIVKRLGLEELAPMSAVGSGPHDISGSHSISGALPGSGSISVSGSHSIRSMPFVGRDQELLQLTEAFHELGAKPTVVLVEGESGMGKTALVERFLERVTEVGVTPVVLTGRCYEREQVPYKAFDGVADSLYRVLSRMHPDEVAWTMPLYPGLLPLLFPGLKRVEAIARAPLVSLLPDPQAQRTRMFGAFREVLQRLAQRSPLIIVLDDLQWTCPDSLTLFEEVFGHEDAPPALVLGTVRPMGEGKRKALNKAMGMIADVRTVRVASLPANQAHELATLLMPGRSSSHIESLVRETGGHPLFVHELARHAQSGERGLSLDGALQARMADLPPTATALLTVLCVAGGPITQEVAAFAANLDGTAFAKATSVLRVAYLARTDGSRTSDSIEPYHHRVREAFVAMLDESQRSITHYDLTRALERTGGDARAIVRHAVAAGMPGRAAAHAEEAAQKAIATMAFDQAAEFYATALAVGSKEPQTQLRLLLARAEILKSAGRGREAAEGFMLAAQAEQAEHALRVQCQIQAVEQRLIAGQLDEGFAASTALLADIGEPMAKTPARALTSLMWNRLRLSMGRKVYPRREEGEIDRDTLNRLDVLRAMAMGLCATDLVRSADFNARFLREARRAGEPVRLVQGLGVEACFLSAQGSRGALSARALLAQMAAIAATRPGDLYLAGYLLGIEGIISMNEGRFTAAAALMESAEQLYERLNNSSMLERNSVLMFRLVALRLSGMNAAVRGALPTRLRDAHRRGDTYFETTLRTFRTHDLLSLDQLALAREGLAQATWTPVERGFHLQHYFALDARGELALYEGKAAAALTEIEQGHIHIKRSMLLRVGLLRVLYQWVHARLLLSAAASDATRSGDLRAAGHLARKLSGEGLGCASVYALLIRAAQATLEARPDSAAELLRECIALADEQEMASSAAAARYRLGHMLAAEEGVTLLREAHAWCASEGVVDPERYFGVLAPGFPRG